MATHQVKVGIISREDYVKRSLAIASGKYKPQKSEPKLWFTSLRSMAEVLSDENQALLRQIIESKPESLAELVEVSGRNKSNLSRTLKMLQGFGIVEMSRVNNRVVPHVKATDFKLEFGLSTSDNWRRQA